MCRNQVAEAADPGVGALRVDRRRSWSTMPELPELEIIREVLQRRVIGEVVAEVEVRPPGGPVVARDLTHRGFEVSLKGKALKSVSRRGKLFIISLESSLPLYLAINPKLTGRLQLANPGDRLAAKTHVVVKFAGGRELRYLDQKQMGQLYLVSDLATIPGYADMGPEPLNLSLEAFRQRLRLFRGEIKGVLT